MTIPATTPADGELLPCPFCQGAHVKPIEDEGRWAVFCFYCAISGPSELFRSDAILSWNARRAQTAPPKRVIPAGYCSEGDRCVCGGDTPGVRAGCGNWRAPDARPLATPSPGKAPAPVAWIRPDELSKAKAAPHLCRVEPTQRMVDFVPLYASPGRADERDAERYRALRAVGGRTWTAGDYRAVDADYDKCVDAMIEEAEQ